jgi:hypothetical protein
MNQSLMENYEDYDGLARHETLLAREFHIMIIKQKISELHAKIDILSKDEKVNEQKQQFNKSEIQFKLFNLILLPSCIIIMLYLGYLFGDY